MKGFLLRLRYVLAFQHLMSGTDAPACVDRASIAPQFFRQR
jgi:hypothetical protein